MYMLINIHNIHSLSITYIVYLFKFKKIFKKHLELKKKAVPLHP